MLITKKTDEIIELIGDIEYRIINNTLGKLLILLTSENEKKIKELEEELNNKYKKYIQEIIIENQEKDPFFVKRIRKLCPEKNSIIHRNISYTGWNKSSEDKYKNKDKIPNIIAGYSFKGGMGRSSTLAYLAYFYSLIEKKVVVLDCDFEAPGIASMFFEKEERKKKAGVLDYLIDLNIEDKLELDKYYLKAEDTDLYLFPSGIDYNIENYINKISKIDFNSTSYINKLGKLIDKINEDIKPSFIFIDLRAGINESNGAILKNISGTNLLFFNSEEQSKDGLEIILPSLNLDNNFIMNSTIRYNLSTSERKKKNLEFKKHIKEKFNSFEEKIVPLPYNNILLLNEIPDFKEFVENEVDVYLAKRNKNNIEEIIKKEVRAEDNNYHSSIRYLIDMINKLENQQDQEIKQIEI